MTATENQAKRVLASQVGEKLSGHVLEYGNVRACASGTTIVREAAALHSLFLILHGSASVMIEAGGKSLLLGHLGPGDWFGELSLLAGTGAASSSIVADTAVDVLEIPHDMFMRMRSEHPEASAAVLRVFIAGLAERIRASDATIAQLDADHFILESAEKREAARSLIRSILQKLAGVAERKQ